MATCRTYELAWKQAGAARPGLSAFTKVSKQAMGLALEHSPLCGEFEWLASTHLQSQEPVETFPAPDLAALLQAACVDQEAAIHKEGGAGNVISRIRGQPDG